jgi:uncharacterized phiE125 gp8 family phage protein
MSAVLLVPPDGEPLSLTEAKQFLRVDHDDDDAVISALIAAARTHMEAITRRVLLTQTWRLVLDAWPADGRIVARIGPLQALHAARVFDADGVAQALEVESFVVDAAANVIAAPRWALPPPGRSHAGIALDVLCGYGALGSDVPADLRHALRLLVAHGYEHRGLVAVGGAVAMQPGGFSALIAPYRVLSL